MAKKTKTIKRKKTTKQKTAKRTAPRLDVNQLAFRLVQESTAERRP